MDRSLRSAPARRLASWHIASCALCALAGLSAWTPASASADRGYLFPMERRAGEQSLTPEVVAEVHDGVRAGLEAADVTVLEEALLQGELATCAVDRCAERVAVALGVDFTVYLAIWPSLRGHEPEIVVSVATARNGTYIAECRVGADGESPCARTSYAEAARLAAERAVAKYARGPGPWLVVRGTPEGARILVDGAEAGAVPDRIAASPGEHHVTIEHDGYETETHVVLVPDGAGGEAPLEVALVAGGGGLGGLGWLAIVSWVGAGALVGLGVGTLASGTEIERVGTWGLEEHAPDGIAAAIFFGGGAVAAGIGFLLWVLDSPGGPAAGSARRHPLTWTF